MQIGDVDIETMAALLAAPGGLPPAATGERQPTTGTGAKTVINAHFTPKFVRTVFVVVRFSTTTSNHIPKALQPFFGSAHSTVKGWACANKTAHADLINYGFLPTPFCGTGS